MAEITLEDVQQIVRQAAEQAVQQAASSAAAQAAAQVAQQVEQQVADSISSAISKLMQSQTQTTGATMVTGRSELADIGGAERLEKDQMADSGIIFANAKRTYDEYQDVSLESIRRNRSHVDKILADAQQYDNQRQNIANQALQNAVETANMVGKNAVVNVDNLQKQHTAHRDKATDELWGADVQEGAAESMVIRQTQLDDAALKSIAAIVSIAMAETLKAQAKV